ncbi:MAG: hypothetical protein J0L72_09475 [Armatimonadetes bacterium]|nr:hypothetical protein [Armatimonadota bacterium]
MTSIFEGKLNGLTNMARDAMLLHHADHGRSTVRVYQWDRPWVTLGRFQNATTALVESCQVPWAKRITGGKAVLHGHDVTVGMAIPLSEIPGANPRAVKLVYRAITAPMIEAMNLCGLPAVLGEEHQSRSVSKSTDCFSVISGNDIVHAQLGIKICGCALRLTDRAVLLQASIPIALPTVDVRSVYAQPAPVYVSELDPIRLADALQETFDRLTIKGS